MSKQTLTTRRKKILEDLDGVHYDYTEIPSITDYCGDIKAAIVPPLLPGIGTEEAKRIGQQSYFDTGDGLEYFIRMAQDRGMDADLFRDALHESYHVTQWERMTVDFPHLFHRCDATVASYTRLQTHGVAHGLVTQSCLQTWAIPLLTSQGKIGFYRQEALGGFRESGWFRKKDSPEPVLRGMKRMDAAPEELVFIEDNLDNIETAKTISGDILTVFISRKPLDPVTAQKRGVDIHVPDLKSFYNMAANALDAAPPVKAAPRSHEDPVHEGPVFAHAIPLIP
ncbi:MAG: hypothetical protein WC989_06625 [Micavibrio sp.]